MERDHAATTVQKHVRGATDRARVAELEEELDAMMQSLGAPPPLSETASDDDTDDSAPASVWSNRVDLAPTPIRKRAAVGFDGEDAVAVNRASPSAAAEADGAASMAVHFFPSQSELEPDWGAAGDIALPEERDTAFDGLGPLDRENEFGQLQNVLDGNGTGRLGTLVFSSWNSTVPANDGDGDGDALSENDSDSDDTSSDSDDEPRSSSSNDETETTTSLMETNAEWYTSAVAGAEKTSNEDVDARQVRTLASKFGFVGVPASSVAATASPGRSPGRSFSAESDHLAAAAAEERFACAYCAAVHGSAGGVQLMRCSRCESVCYCSRLCQSNHWAEHKLYCVAPSEATSEEATLDAAAEARWHGETESSCENVDSLPRVVQCDESESTEWRRRSATGDDDEIDDNIDDDAPNTRGWVAAAEEDGAKAQDDAQREGEVIAPHEEVAPPRESEAPKSKSAAVRGVSIAAPSPVAPEAEEPSGHPAGDVGGSAPSDSGVVRFDAAIPMETAAVRKKPKRRSPPPPAQLSSETEESTSSDDRNRRGAGGSSSDDSESDEAEVALAPHRVHVKRETGDGTEEETPLLEAEEAEARAGNEELRASPLSINPLLAAPASAESEGGILLTPSPAASASALEATPVDTSPIRFELSSDEAESSFTDASSSFAAAPTALILAALAPSSSSTSSPTAAQRAQWASPNGVQVDVIGGFPTPDADGGAIDVEDDVAVVSPAAAPAAPAAPTSAGKGLLGMIRRRMSKSAGKKTAAAAVAAVNAEADETAAANDADGGATSPLLLTMMSKESGSSSSPKSLLHLDAFDRDELKARIKRLRKSVTAARNAVARSRRAVQGGSPSLKQLQRMNRARQRNSMRRAKRKTPSQTKSVAAGAALEALLLTMDYERGIAVKNTAKIDARIDRIEEEKERRRLATDALREKLARSLGVSLHELDTPLPAGVTRQTPAQLAALNKLRAQVAERQLAVDSATSRLSELRASHHEQLLGIKQLERKSKTWKKMFSSIKVELGGVRKRLNEKRARAGSRASRMTGTPRLGAASPLYYSPLLSKGSARSNRSRHLFHRSLSPHVHIKSTKVPISSSSSLRMQQLLKEHEAGEDRIGDGGALQLILPRSQDGPESETGDDDELDDDIALAAAIHHEKERQLQLRAQIAAVSSGSSSLRREKDGVIDLALAAQARAEAKEAAEMEYEAEQDRGRVQKAQLEAVMQSVEAAQAVLVQQRTLQLEEEKARVARGKVLLRDVDLWRSSVQQRKTQTSTSLRSFQIALAKKRRERQAARDRELIAEAEAEKVAKAKHADRERRILLACLKQGISRKVWDARDARRQAKRYAAATVLQSRARGAPPRRWFRTVQHERAVEAARVAKVQREGATSMQCGWRSHAARQECRRREAAAAIQMRLDAAATALQCLVRKHVADADLVRRRAAAAELARQHGSALKLQGVRRIQVARRTRSVLAHEYVLYGAATAIACVARARAAKKVHAALKYRRDVKRRRKQRLRNEKAKKEKEARDKEKAKQVARNAGKKGGKGKKAGKGKGKGKGKGSKKAAAAAADDGAGEVDDGPGVTAHWSVVPEGQAAKKHSAEMAALRAQLQVAQAEAARAKEDMAAQKALAKEAREAEKSRRKEMLDAREMVALMRKQERQRTRALAAAAAQTEADEATAKVMEAAAAGIAKHREEQRKKNTPRGSSKKKKRKTPKKKEDASSTSGTPTSKESAAMRRAAASSKGVAKAAKAAADLETQYALSAEQKLLRRAKATSVAAPWSTAEEYATTDAFDETQTQLGFMDALARPMRSGINLDAAISSSAASAMQSSDAAAAAAAAAQKQKQASLRRRNFLKEAAVNNALALAQEREAARPKRWGRT